jgi:hypothetical protein
MCDRCEKKICEGSLNASPDEEVAVRVTVKNRPAFKVGNVHVYCSECMADLITVMEDAFESWYKEGVDHRG